MLKSQQKFRSEKHNIFTEKLHKTALSFNDSKGIKFNRFCRNIYIWNKGRDNSEKRRKQL